LIGVETEYGFRYSQTTRRNSQSLYRVLVSSFAARMPLVESSRNPNRTFLANGGAISWEPSSNTLLGNQGFIEIGTPQCRNPKHVVAYLMAFDRMIADVLDDPLVTSQDFVPQAAIRNNCDGFGQRYGQQENYEVQIARGFWLVLWWVGLLSLLPFLLMHRMMSRLALMITIGVAFKLHSRQQESTSETLSDDFNCDSRRIRMATWLLQICHAPLEWLFQNLCCLTLLRKHRRVLGPFLASRIAFDGSGHVDRSGSFRISCRAVQMNAFIGFSGNGRRRPMIDLAHWFRAICLDDSLSLRAYRKLFRRRQRIQICCGDTSTNEFVRWIQIGSTCLILDAIESNLNFKCPRFKLAPHRMIQRFARDVELTHSVTGYDRSQWTALSIQEHLIKRIRQYFMTRSRVPMEAWEILNAWQLLIGRLQRRKVDSQDADWLLARCDWYTKHSLMLRLPINASMSAYKKIDIRYHEVGVESYFQRLAKFRDVSPIVDSALLDRATRTPPDNSPATRRGYMIREFANSDQDLEIDWDRTELVASSKS
jgi:hypothetical protein